MTEKPSVIRCPKCGHEPNAVSDTCEKCGAVLEKKCGACGFSNSVGKNYCDQCGEPLVFTTKRLQAGPKAAPREPAPKLELQPIQDTVNDRDSSFRKRQAASREQSPAPAPKPPPPPARPAPPVASPPGAKPAGPVGGGAASAPAAPPKGGIKKITAPALGLAMLIALAAAIYFMVVVPLLPRLRLTMAAKEYLMALSQGKYDEAYELLSTNSKAICTLDAYIAYNKDYYDKTPAWQFRNAQIFTMTKTAAMIKYQLREAGGDWKDDYISFVPEHGRWTRPYIWFLFQPIDEALNRKDFAQALFLAQKLYLTDPVDPRSSGYLCASEFFMNLYEKSAESCRRTVEAASSYPVGYSAQDLYWFELYYADSLRYLGRNRAALDEYEKMLKLPDLTLEQQCPLFLNRADVHVNMQDYEKSLADTMRAGEACTQSPSKEDAANRMRYMSGGASEDAIDFAKRSRLQPGMPSVSAVRRRQLDALAAKLGPKGARFMPKDQWIAVHLAGPEYRVFLKQEARNPVSKKTETTDIFVFLVNLWTRNGKVEKAPPLGASSEELKR